VVYLISKPNQLCEFFEELENFGFLRSKISATKNHVRSKKTYTTFAKIKTTSAQKKLKNVVKSWSCDKTWVLGIVFLGSWGVFTSWVLRLGLAVETTQNPRNFVVGKLPVIRSVQLDK